MGALFYCLLVAGVAYFAKLRGRSPLAWAVIALLISPLLSGILLLFLKNLSTDGFRGDTIDTTAKPVPDHESTGPNRTYRGGATKNQEDVDAAISRIEEKLSIDKTEVNTTSAKSSATLGAASVLTSGYNPPQEYVEPIISEPIFDEFNPISQDVSSAEPSSTQKISSVEVIAEPEAEIITASSDNYANEVESGNLVQPTVLENNQVSTQTAEVSSQTTPFCECCVEPLKEGANFCTNCGAPIAK